MAPGGSTPVYKLIKDEIIESILSGELEPGDQIPSQNYYAEQYGVSRKAVRMAVEDLIEKQVLESRKGQGTYVRDIIVNLSGYKRFGQWGQLYEHRDKTLPSRVLSISVIEAEKLLANGLGIAPGDKVVRIARVRYVGDVPLCVQYSHMAYSRVGHIDFERAGLDKGSLYGVLREQAGLVVSYTDELLRAVRCPGDIADCLELTPRDPVMYIIRRVFGPENVPVEYCEVYYRCDINGIQHGTLG